MKLLQALLLASATLAVASCSALAAPMPSPSPSPLMLPTYGPSKPQTPTAPVLKKEGKSVPQPAGAGGGAGAGKEGTLAPTGEKKEEGKEEKPEGLPAQKEEGTGLGAGAGPEGAPTPGPSPLDALHSDGPSPVNGPDDAPGAGDGDGDAPTRRSRSTGREPKRLVTMTSLARPPPPLWVKRPNYY